MSMITSIFGDMQKAKAIKSNQAKAMEQVYYARPYFLPSMQRNMYQGIMDMYGSLYGEAMGWPDFMQNDFGRAFDPTNKYFNFGDYGMGKNNPSYVPFADRFGAGSKDMQGYYTAAGSSGASADGSVPAWIERGSSILGSNTPGDKSMFKDLPYINPRPTAFGQILSDEMQVGKAWQQEAYNALQPATLDKYYNIASPYVQRGARDAAAFRGNLWGGIGQAQETEAMRKLGEDITMQQQQRYYTALTNAAASSELERTTRGYMLNLPLQYMQNYLNTGTGANTAASEMGVNTSLTTMQQSVAALQQAIGNAQKAQDDITSMFGMIGGGMGGKG